MNCYIISINRYIKFFLIFLILLLYPDYSISHPQDYKKFKAIEMEVLRDGKSIGFSNYFFKHKDDFLEVRNETKFEVELLGVKLFTISSQGIEKYYKNLLVSFNSETFQNKKRKFVDLKLSENKKEFKIIGSSFRGNVSINSIVGNWWNHGILETDNQISPLSGSIKTQVVKFIGEENIIINDKNYSTEHYKLQSKDPNTPEDKKLNFDIWYNKDENLILKIVYDKMGYWEYNVISFEKN